MSWNGHFLGVLVLVWVGLFIIWDIHGLAKRCAGLAMTSAGLATGRHSH